MPDPLGLSRSRSDIVLLPGPERQPWKGVYYQPLRPDLKHYAPVQELDRRERSREFKDALNSTQATLGLGFTQTSSLTTLDASAPQTLKSTTLPPTTGTDPNQSLCLTVPGEENSMQPFNTQPHEDAFSSRAKLFQTSFPPAAVDLESDAQAAPLSNGDNLKSSSNQCHSPPGASLPIRMSRCRSSVGRVGAASPFSPPKTLYRVPKATAPPPFRAGGVAPLPKSEDMNVSGGDANASHTPQSHSQTQSLAQVYRTSDGVKVYQLAKPKTDDLLPTYRPKPLSRQMHTRMTGRMDYSNSSEINVNNNGNLDHSRTTNRTRPTVNNLERSIEKFVRRKNLEEEEDSRLTNSLSKAQFPSQQRQLQLTNGSLRGELGYFCSKGALQKPDSPLNHTIKSPPSDSHTKQVTAAAAAARMQRHVPLPCTGRPSSPGNRTSTEQRLLRDIFVEGLDLIDRGVIDGKGVWGPQQAP